MGFIEIDNASYEKVTSINIGKYEYLVLMKDGLICYVALSNGEYIFTNPDLTLEGNANTSLSSLNSRIIMKHIIDKAQNFTNDTVALSEYFKKVELILQDSNLINLVKGSLDELSNFEEVTKTMIDHFDNLYLEYSKVVEIEKPITKPKIKAKKIKDSEAANVDTVMIAMLVNIGILLFVMLILNIIR